MKRSIYAYLFAASLLIPSLSIAQRFPKSDVGISIGSTLFFGDLGGANYIGRPLFFDLERSLIKPVGMLSYHYQWKQRVGFRVQASLSGVAGDDKLIQPKAVFAPEWFRYYRNLNFHSRIWEVSAQAEFYFTRFEPGDLTRRWGAYGLIGVGMFHFNPKTEYNGTTVELRPLHTEGEGFPGIDVKEYNLYQPCIPIGLGLRYNVTRDFIVGFEYADRKTFTDYIDDVSKNYVSQTDFNNYFANDLTTAALAYQLSVRSDEIDPDGIYSDITAPTQQRGDPTQNDHYIFTTFTFAYVIGQRHVSAKQQMKCMKWGGSGGSSGVHTYKK